VSEIRIFLSYARKDNSLPPGTARGTGFVTTLKGELEYEFQKHGDPTPKIWWDEEQVEDGDVFNPKIEEAINGSDLLLIVLSRNWLTRQHCRKELELFEQRWRTTDAFDVQHRIKIVRKNYVEPGDLPAIEREAYSSLPIQSGYSFFKFEGTRQEPSLERLFFDRGKRLSSEYGKQANALGGHLWRAARNIMLRRSPIEKNPIGPIEQRPPAPRNGRTVYLAKPALDMVKTYQRVARELHGWGFDVVPGVDENIPFDATATDFVDAALAKAEVAIHLLGTDEGYAPAKTDHIVKLQLARAQVKSKNANADNRGSPRFRRLIWAPKVIEEMPADAPMREPVVTVEAFSPVLWPDTVYGDSSSNLVVFLRQTLVDNAWIETELPDTIKSDSEVYVCHRREDRTYAKNVAKALRHRKNVKTQLSVVDGNEAERIELNRKYLLARVGGVGTILGP
jgi:hypothetical protein